MSHLYCTKESEIVFYCAHCGHIEDAPGVQAVIDAAESLTDAFTHEGFGRCWITLNDAVRALKEMRGMEGMDGGVKNE